MKRILILIIGLFGVAQAQFAPTSAKTAFKNGISIGTMDSAAYAANDSLVVVINRQGRMMYRSTDGYWKLLANAASSDYVPYVGAVSNVFLGSNRIKADAFDLGIPSSSTDSIGRMRWNADDLTMNIGLTSSVVLQSGQEMLILVKNQTGVTIPNGTVVRQSGVVGASGRLKVEPFLANGTHNSNQVLGLTTEDIPNGGDGFVAYFGKVNKVNTAAYPDSTILYASPTVAGGLTNVVPEAPNNIVKIGTVVKSAASNGIIFARVVAGSNINQDEGVQLTNPLNNSLLVYDSLTTLWKDKTLVEIGAVRVQDTAAMLNPYLRKSDTASMLSPFVQYSDTTGLLSQVVRTFGTQTIGGNKTFSNDIVVNGITAGMGAGNISGNTAFGNQAIRFNTTGSNNSAFGSSALSTNTTGQTNTAIGAISLFSLDGGSFNAALGYNSMGGITTGSNNVAIGSSAGTLTNGGSSLTSANQSVLIGSGVRSSAVGNTNEIVIGFDARGNGSNTVTIGNSSITNNYFNGTINGTSLSMSGGGEFGSGVTIKSASGIILQNASANSSFTLYNSGATGISAFYIPVNTGIGTTTPDPYTSNIATLSLGGTNANFSGAINFQVNGVSKSNFVNRLDYLTADMISGNGFRVRIAGNDYFNIAPDGTVMVNTTTTDGTNKLIVNGGIKGTSLSMSGAGRFGGSTIATNLSANIGANTSFYFNELSATALEFSTVNNANNATRNLSINPNGGDVLIGTTTTDGTNKLIVNGGVKGTFGTFERTTAATALSTIVAGGGYQLTMTNSASSNYQYGWYMSANDLILRNITGGINNLTLTSTGAATFSSSVTATGFIVSSDLRYKDIISQDGDLYSYTLKADSTKQIHYGYIAQEVEKTMPFAVTTNADGYKAVNYIEVHAIKIRELEKRIEQLEKMINK